MAQRKYTDEQRAEALELYKQHGPAEAGRRTGIRSRTITEWARRAGVVDTRKNVHEIAVRAAELSFAEKRAELRPKLLAKVNDLLARMDEPHQEFVGQHGKAVTYDRAPAAAVKAYATSVGILIDKMRLELGEHTSSDRHENVSQLDREIDQLLGEMNRRDVGHANGNGHPAV